MINSEELTSIGKELFIQDKVLVKNLVPSCHGVDLDNNLGTISVTEYPEPLGKCIEWRQSELTVESEDQEWAVVQEATNGRIRTTSGSGCYGQAVIQFKLSNLKSFRVACERVTFTQHDEKTSCCFSFQKESKYFVNYLKSILQTTQCRRDRKLFLVMMNQPEAENLNKSFAQLELFPESKSDVVWTFMQKFHDRPLETTMETFSRLTDGLLYKNDEEIAERLSSSLQGEDVTARNGDEYQMVAQQTLQTPRQVPPRILPLNQQHWEIFFQESGAIPEYETVKEIIFRGGVDPPIRKDVWKFLLDYYPWTTTFEEREALRRNKVAEYYRMKLQWKSMSKDQEDRFSDYKERKSLIEKDVARTDRTMQFFAEDNNPHLEQLQDILMTYVMYNFDLGYVQGMSDLLSPLLVLLEDEVDTFWCFTSLINRMIRNFDVDQAGMKEQLQQLYQLLNVAEPELANYLLRQESSNMFFCFRWLLVWFKREFSFQDIYILWETLFAESRCPNYHLLVCLAILETEKENLIRNEYGFTEILKHINELSGNIDLELTLCKAEGLYKQLSESELPNAVRVILGLTVLNQGNSSEDDDNLDEVDAPRTMSQDANETLPSSRIAYSVDTEEVDFENAISMHFI